MIMKTAENAGGNDSKSCRN